MQADVVKRLARDCGFELAGIADAVSIMDDFARYQSWAAKGMAGEMRYLTDRRAEVRSCPTNLLEGARSVICVGKLYNRPVAPVPEDAAVISRYAWGRDYHDVLREGLERLASAISLVEPHQFKICVDTAPLLERSYARQAGLGWIGKNTCLINEPQGSWFLLGEIVTSLEITPDVPPPDRCGSCTRCIDACPTDALIPNGDRYELDARRCISYLNIELRGAIPEDLRPQMGGLIFGCDICQEVCPWNSRAPETDDAAFLPAYNTVPSLESLAALSEEGYRNTFRNTPVTRPRYAGFLRNVATAMGSLGLPRFRKSLEYLAASPNELVAEHARWALQQVTKTEDAEVKTCAS